MADAAIARAADTLAEHALWLVGAGVIGALLLLGAILVAIRVGDRFRPYLLSRAFVPGTYLALHLILGLAMVGATSAFVELAEESVAGSELATFDAAFTRALQEERTLAWDRVFTTVSLLGSRQVLTFTTIGVALGLFLRCERLLACGWVIAQAGGGLLNQVLKETFERARPEFAEPSLAALSWSFPSGHAMGTFILCGVGCYVLLRLTRSSTRLAAAIAVALSWSMVMAFSRLYLGVHFASDVIGGLIAGVAWVAVCVSGLEVARRMTGAERQV